MRVLQPRQIAFRVGGVPEVKPDDAVAADRLFESARREDPRLFDGPVVLVTASLEDDLADPLVLSWSAGRYRCLALRTLGYCISTLFVTALIPTMEGGVLVGRAAPHTAKAGLWQLPGGSVTPPPPGRPLDLSYLAAEASRELLEETSIELKPETFSLRAVSQGDHHNIGVCFSAAETDSADGSAIEPFISSQTDSEFSEVASVRTPAGAIRLGHSVDYLPHYLNLWRLGSPRCCAW